MLIEMNAIIAGVAGTAVMTGFVYLVSYVFKTNCKVVWVLGNMLSRKYPIPVGILAHYMIGVFFSIIYTILWSNGVGSPTLGSGLVFGALNGLFAMGFWYSFIKLHPHPPALNVPVYVTVIGTGHLFFSTGVVLCYNLLNA